MSKRQFRTKQAIEAFESCRSCTTLPSNKKAEVTAELNKAKARMEQQDAEVSWCPQFYCWLVPTVLVLSRCLFFERTVTPFRMLYRTMPVCGAWTYEVQ